MRGQRGGWPALDGLRAFAVGAVMLDHLYVPHWQGGQMGVDIFFVISGFLITWLLVGERDTTEGFSYGAFYVRRALRLLPALGLTIVGVLVLLAIGLHAYRSPTLRLMPFTVFYVANWDWNNLGTNNLLSHTWSLAIEEQFYLLWPVAAVAILRQRVRRETVGVLLAAAAVMEMAARFLYLHGGGSQEVSYHALYFRSDGLLLGCAIAFLAKSSWAKHISGPLGRRLLRPASWLAVAVLVWELWFVIPGPRAQWLWIPVTVAGAAVLVAGVIGETGGLLHRLLACGPMVWVGRRSYGLYLFSWPIYRAFFSTHLGIAERDPLAVVASVAAAAVSYEMVEKWALRQKSRFVPGGRRLDSELGDPGLPVGVRIPPSAGGD